MATFVIQIEEAFIEVHFTSNYSCISRETYCSAEAFVKENMNSRPGTSDLLFTLCFIRNSKGSTVNYLKIESRYEHLKRLILEQLKDQVILEIEDFKLQDETFKWTFSLN